MVDRLTKALRAANDTAEGGFDLIEELRAESAAWRRRCEALYLIADPDKTEGVLEVISSIEALDETEAS
jgi:hypothetical protein